MGEMQTMKILLATYWPIPHVGGVWTYMSQLKTKLESYGHEVDLLGYDEANINVTMLSKGQVIGRDKIIPLITANLTPENYPAMYVNFLVKWTEFQRYVYELSAAYFGINDYDIIHTQDILSTIGISRIKNKEIPLVATLHGSVAHEIRRQLLTIHKSDTSYMARAYYDDLERAGAVAADTTIVCNQWLRNVLTGEFNVPDQQLKVLHYGFDTENFLRRMKEKTSVERPKDKKVIIYTGRLVELKGLNYLLSALGELKKVRNDWECWIVGSGEKEAELQNQSFSLGLTDSVRFLGKRNDVPALLAHSDILVLPTLIENQPLSVIEAQIAGKAIIASDVGGVPEIIKHGVTGLLTPPKDIQMLSSQINLLLSDDRFRKKLGSNAKRWGMTHWSMDKGVKKLIDVYQHAIYRKKMG